MNRYRIKLKTLYDVARLVTLARRTDNRKKVLISDNQGMVVNARSLLGAMYAMNFDEVWVDSDADLTDKLRDMII